MTCIFYSFAGEGLGHATRTMSVLDHLDPNLEVHLFTFGEAYNFFESQNYPHLHRIHGLQFGRTAGKINLTGTLARCGKFANYYRDNFNYIAALAKALNPTLCVVDCEPILPRVAKSINRPYISIDNQHRFSRCVLNELPIDLRLYAWLMGVGTELLTPDPDVCIISTFYHSKIKKEANKTWLTNCLMRKSFATHAITDEGHILVYYKVSCGDRILELLSQATTDETVKVYNCPTAKRAYSKFQYFNTSPQFVKDLASCKMLFSSAGNQLLGEAFYYGKPIFAVPEPNQPEQIINAFFVQSLNHGTYCKLPDLKLSTVENFLKHPHTRHASGINGVNTVIKHIEKLLEKHEIEEKDKDIVYI